MMKIAHLAEAFHLNCEVHDAYNALNSLASLHVIMAIQNCDWFEVLAIHTPGKYDLDYLSYGLVQPIPINAEGMASVPGRPGLASRSIGVSCRQPRLLTSASQPSRGAPVADGDLNT